MVYYRIICFLFLWNSVIFLKKDNLLDFVMNS